MTHEAIIEKVKKKYAGADEATIHAVLQTLQDDAFALRLPIPSPARETSNEPARDIPKPPLLKFVGENPSPEAYRKLSFDERGALSEQVKEKNHQWLEEKFATLQAAWLMLMEGKIIASGDHLKTYPQREQISEILSRYGKQPFIFIDDFLLAIEESWHSTVYNVEVKLISGEVLRRTLPIHCVEKWNKSPFVRINPHRTALAGRDIFLELQPAILLDFANRRTKMFAAEPV